MNLTITEHSLTTRAGVLTVPFATGNVKIVTFPYFLHAKYITEEIYLARLLDKHDVISTRPSQR